MRGTHRTVDRQQSRGSRPAGRSRARLGRNHLEGCCGSAPDATGGQPRPALWKTSSVFGCSSGSRADSCRLRRVGHSSPAPRRCSSSSPISKRRVSAPVAPPVRIRIVLESATRRFIGSSSALVDLRKTLPGIDVTLSVDHRGDPIRCTRERQGRRGAAHDGVRTCGAPRGVPPLLGRDRLRDGQLVSRVASACQEEGPRARRPGHHHTHHVADPRGEARWFMAKVFGRSRPRLHLNACRSPRPFWTWLWAGMGVGVLSEWMAGPSFERTGSRRASPRSGATEAPLADRVAEGSS